MQKQQRAKIAKKPPMKGGAGYSKIRNEVLAKALNYMRFIEEWGSGLKRVNDVLVEYGIRKVSVEDAGFAVRMNVHRVKATGSSQEAGALKRGAGALNGALERDSGALNGALKQSVGAFEEKVLAAIARRPGINRKGIIEQVGVAPRSGVDEMQGLRNRLYAVRGR